MSEQIIVIKSRVKVTAAPAPPAPAVAPVMLLPSITRPARLAPQKPLLRFITKGFYKAESPIELWQQLRALGWRDTEETTRGEMVRLFRGHARVSIRTNGYVFAGGQGGDALDQLDKLSRGAK